MNPYQVGVASRLHHVYSMTKGYVGHYAGLKNTPCVQQSTGLGILGLAVMLTIDSWMSSGLLVRVTTSHLLIYMQFLFPRDLYIYTYNIILYIYIYIQASQALDIRPSIADIACSGLLFSQ